MCHFVVTLAFCFGVVWCNVVLACLGFAADCLVWYLIGCLLCCYLLVFCCAFGVLDLCVLFDLFCLFVNCGTMVCALLCGVILLVFTVIG